MFAKTGKSIIRKIDPALILMILAFFLINYFGYSNHALFHFMAELVTVIISCSLFLFVWIMREKIENGYFSVIGIGLLFVSILDLFHILSFEGMAALSSISLDQSIYFWLAARLLQGLTFLIAPVCAGRTAKYRLAVLLYAAVSTLAGLFIYRFDLPAILNPDGNFSSIRLILELAISSLFLLALIHIIARRARFDARVFQVFLGAAVLALASELTIGWNTSQAHLTSILGLDLKILSYLLIFQIVLVSGISEPQEILYSKLQTDWQLLRDLFQNTGEGILILNQENRIVQINPAAENILRAGKNSLLQSNFYRFFPIDQNQDFRHAFALMQQKKPFSLGILTRRVDHSKCMLEMDAAPRFQNRTFTGYFIVFRDTTDQYAKAKRLDEARRLYQTIFMDAPIRIWDLDYSRVKKAIDEIRDNGISDFQQYFNQNPEVIEKLAGLVKINTYNNRVADLYNKPDEKGQRIHNLNQIFWEGSYAYYVRELLTIAEGKKTNTYEITTRSADGKTRYSIINWAVLPGHEKDYSRVIVSADDITERKQAEQELQASESKFRLLAENAGVGIGYFDLDGRVIFLNNKALSFLNLNSLDYFGKKIHGIVGRKEGAKVLSRIADSARSGKTLDYDDSFQVSGENKWFHTNYSPILDHLGNCIGVQVITSDITRQKELENELLSLSRFPEENPYPIMRFSNTGELLYSNQGGQPFLEMWRFFETKRLPAEIQSMISTILAKGRSEVVYLDCNERVYSMFIVPISGQGYVNIYGRDITDLKKAEAELTKYSRELENLVAEKTRELLEARERLARQEKLALMGQLASGVGHELRNPLAVINNALYMLRLAKTRQEPDFENYLNIIDQEVAASNKIITDLLTFARIKPANMEPVQITELIQGILQKFVPPENVVIDNRLAKDIPEILADGKQVEQVITNLVTNAYQAMPQGGNLTIDAMAAKDFLKIEFADTGVGISPENIEKIFEPLFTTKAKGIGLGLTISKMLAEVNGGKITVKSKVGLGSVFVLHLPIYRRND